MRTALAVPINYYTCRPNIHYLLYIVSIRNKILPVFIISLTDDVHVLARTGTGADGRDSLATGGEIRELVLVVRSLEQRMTSLKRETAEEDEAEGG